MIINDQGFAVYVDTNEAIHFTNAGGDCIELAPAVVPAGHPKAGRGPVVAMSDTEDAGPEKEVKIWTVSEVAAFAQAFVDGKFAGVIQQAEEKAAEAAKTEETLVTTAS